MTTSPLVAPDVQQRLAKLSVCAIADAMAKLKIQGHLVDVSLMRGIKVPRTRTFADLHLRCKSYPPWAPHTSGVFGGLLATASKARGVAGIVTDGRVRDVQEISSMGFPAFSRGTSVHGQQGTTTVVDVNCPSW
ncbi:Ribonuclease E inhibitor RraA/Dimethylmenaquinone methyltransferase [Phytophthora cactorum]|nr:Ribonuclease E inhibitor RraA/Dimethylmenaquinone methyltransferase [Phytophthora cactorum]